MIRKNLSKALDFSRSVLPLTDLLSTADVDQDGSFLVLDTTEVKALAQPKQVSLSGVVNSFSTLPVFKAAVSGIAQQTFRQLNFAYGSFYDKVPQPSSGVTSRNAILCRETAVGDGVTVISGSRFIIPTSGIYNLEFSAQFEKTTGGNDDVDIWFVQNNQDIPWSNTRFTLTGNNGHSVAAWNYFFNAGAGDNLQIYWSSLDSSSKLAAYSGLTNPTRPDIPSIIVTVEQVS